MLIKLDFSSDHPIYAQIRDQIVLGIARGDLSPGERLPTIRALAEESGVNMMTVSKAYQLLRQEGYITTDRRNGAAVSSGGKRGPAKQTIDGLRLRFGELRLAGYDWEQVRELCQRLFEEGKE